MEWSELCLQVNIQPWLGKVLIYSVQITEEWICETPPPLRLKNLKTL